MGTETLGHIGAYIRPSAVLFDLDDTIVSYDIAGRHAWDEICAEYYKGLGFDSAAEFRTLIDGSREWYWSDAGRFLKGRLDLRSARREIVSDAFTRSGRSGEIKAFEIADRFTARHEELIHPFPGTTAVLEAIRCAGVRMGMLTNGASDRQNGKIDRFGLRDYFEFCLVEGDLGFGKPDRRMFMKALELLDLEASEVWMVGDNPDLDIFPANELGIFSIWVDRGNWSREKAVQARPGRMIGSLSELKDMMT